MPKISATGSKNILVGYLIKILVSTISSVGILTAISSVVILKLDLDLEYCKYISVGITIISSIIISYVSISGFKNNFLMMSLISVILLALFIFINFLINETGALYLIVKLIGVFVSATIVSLFKSTKKRWCNG